MGIGKGLKPCPFCGSEDVRLEVSATPHFTERWVECRGCEASSAHIEGDLFSAERAWNQRTANLTRTEPGEPVAYRWKWDDEDRWHVVLSKESIPPVIRDCQPMMDPDLRGRYEPLYLRAAIAQAEGATP